MQGMVLPFCILCIEPQQLGTITHAAAREGVLRPLLRDDCLHGGEQGGADASKQRSGACEGD